MTKINLKPSPGYILIEPQESEKKTASGIVLPDSHEEKPSKGKVLVVGSAIYDDGREIVSPVKVGDTVIYKKWGGNEYKVEDKEYLFVEFKDILAIEGGKE
jgi:chaperonin GroES